MTLRLLILLCLLASGSLVPAAESPARPPNLVFILPDDVGYGDLSCYGATKIKTPNLDKLASQGLRFTDAHAPSAQCGPTRYSVLTGDHGFRNAAVAPGVLDGLAPLCIDVNKLTLPKLLKQAGYTTGMVGKWALGLGPSRPVDYNKPLIPGPLEVGFDYAFFLSANADRVPCVYIENHNVVNYDPADPIRVQYNNGSRRVVLAGQPRLGTQQGGTAALWDDNEMAQTFADKAIAFIERSKDQPFFLYLAPNDCHVPRTVNPRFRGTSEAGVRGDQMQQLDYHVGRVMDAIDRLGLAENTLFIFTSDNGGDLDNGGDPASGTTQTNNGHTYNGVLRGVKAGIYEGGSRVPFIARWPGHIPAGKVSDQLITHLDLMATMAALLNRPLPNDVAVDSLNMLPALLEVKPAQPYRDFVIMHSGGQNLAIRQGPWKYIPGSRELFNLAEDLSERNNLAAANPAKVQELTELLQKIRTSGRSRP